VYSEQELKGLLPVAVLAEIPEISSPLDQVRVQRRMWLGWATAIFVICVIVAGSAFSYLRG